MNTLSIGTKKRIDSIDLLRGIIMVIMAIDHVRDFFHITASTDAPTNLATTTPQLFFTRWITHFCAPVFVFLAGTGAYLHGNRDITRGQLARFLFTRGLWLIVLELTLFHFYWSRNLDFSQMGGFVLWALGCSMIVLSVLVYLPLPVTAGFGLVLIAGHNAFDS